MTEPTNETGETTATDDTEPDATPDAEPDATQDTDEESERDDDHLQDIDAGCGCAEVWETLSEQRDE